MTTTALVHNPHALEPANATEALDAAKVLSQSGLFNHLPNPGAVFAVLAKARELGVPMMAGLTGINVIKGKVTLGAELMVACCVSKEACQYFTMVESTAERAIYKTRRAGADEVRHSFTMEDAQRMGLAGNDNYRKQPATMLRHRCAAALARMVYPDILAGCYTPDELDETPQTEHVPSAPIPPAVRAQLPEAVQSPARAATGVKPRKTEVEKFREVAPTLALQPLQEAYRAAQEKVMASREKNPQKADAALGDLAEIYEARVKELQGGEPDAEEVPQD